MAWLRRTATSLTAALVLVAPIGPAESASEPSATLVIALESARDSYVQAQQRVAVLSANSIRLDANAASAAESAERLHAEVSNDGGGLLSAVSGLLGAGSSDLDRATEAADNAAFTRELADRGAAALADAIAAAEDARIAWERAERRQRRLEASWTADEAAAAAIERSRFAPSYDVPDTEQDRRNHRAQSTWHRQLRAVARNAVVPPPAADLADPTSLPTPLEPVRDARNELSPGIAQIDPPGRRPVVVLPTETVRAVSEALRRVGTSDSTDPTAYACGGLVAEAWSALDLPADAAGQWDELLTVPTDSAQPGDVVLLGSRAAGIDGTGVYVGRGQAVVVDPDTGVASVRRLEDDVLAVRRPGFAGSHAAAPAGGRCGAEVTVDTSAPLQLPMAPGSYVLTSSYGEPGERWSSGEHTGLDFAAPIGTPVFAARAGTVIVEHPDWAGTLVRIDHGGGLETWYAHLSTTDLATGDSLEAGEPVGLVGDLGNTTGPHLHFEVRIEGTPYDPAPLLGLSDVG